MKKALVLLPLNDAQKARFSHECPDVEFNFVQSGCENAGLLEDVEIVVGNPSADLLKAADKLELVQLCSAGADAYISPGVIAERTRLANASGAYGKTVSEHSFALLLAVQKKLHLYRDMQMLASWEDLGSVSTLSDSTVVIVGMGDIGLEFAKFAKVFGAKVLGVKRRPCAVLPANIDAVYTTDQIDSLLPGADVIVSFLPGNKYTYHFFTAERFKLMKRSAIFINCGRGSAVCPDVLYKALKEKTIAAAAIDVTDPEPLPASHPLWEENNILITPHVAGGFHIPCTLEKIVSIAIDNINSLNQGRPLKNLVNFSTGYRD